MLNPSNLFAFDLHKENESIITTVLFAEVMKEKN